MKTILHKLFPFFLLLAGLVLSFACTRKETKLNKPENSDVKISSISCDTISSLISIVNNDTLIYNRIKYTLPYDTIFILANNRDIWINNSFIYLGKKFTLYEGENNNNPTFKMLPIPKNSIHVFEFESNDTLLKVYIHFEFSYTDLYTELKCTKDGWIISKQKMHVR